MIAGRDATVASIKRTNGNEEKAVSMLLQLPVARRVDDVSRTGSLRQPVLRLRIWRHAARFTLAKIQQFGCQRLVAPMASRINCHQGGWRRGTLCYVGTVPDGLYGSGAL